MKKILLLIAGLSLLACDDDSGVETHEFRNSLVNLYSLRSITSKTPIDLNGDGVPQTDLMNEACIASTHFDGYYAQFTVNERNGYQSFSVDIPSSNYSFFYEAMTTCFDERTLHNEVKVDETTKKIEITDRFEEWEAEHGSVIEIGWDNEILSFTVVKKLYTSQGWQEVTLNLEYTKTIFD